MVNVDAAYQLDELPRLGPMKAAGLIQGFADQMKRHPDLPILQVRSS